MGNTSSGIAILIIAGATKASFTMPGLRTAEPKTVYVHLFDWTLKPLADMYSSRLPGNQNSLDSFSQMHELLPWNLTASLQTDPFQAV